jgi:hypothetical protein
MTCAFEFREEVPVPLAQRVRPQPNRSRLVDQEEHPCVVLRPPDPGRLRGGRQVHPGTGHGRHVVPLRLDQLRGGHVMLPRPRQGPPGLQLHLGLGQLLLVAFQAFRQLCLGQDATILPQQAERIQLLGQGQPPRLPAEFLDGQLPRLPPDDLQLPGRQGCDAPQLPFQFLGGQDLNPPLSVQASSLDDQAVQSLHRGPLDLAGSLGGHPPAQLHFQAVPPRSLQHGVRGLGPAPPGPGHLGHVLAVVPGPPRPVRHLGREKHHRVGVVVDIAPPVLGMEVGQREHPGRMPFPIPIPHPNPDRLPLHLCQVGRHDLPEKLPGDLRVLLEALAQLGRQGDQRLLRLAEQTPALGQLVPVQVAAPGHLAQQFGRRQLLPGRVPAQLPPQVRVVDFGLHQTIPRQVTGTGCQPSPFLRFLQVPAEVQDDPGRRTHAGAIVVTDQQVHGSAPRNGLQLVFPQI